MLQIDSMPQRASKGQDTKTDTLKLAKHREGCLICGKELVYTDSSILQTCIYCGKEKSSAIHCSEGHFVCDECHRADALTMLETITGNSKETNPIQLAREIMATSAFNMHGPEHHVMVPAVLLRTLSNLGVSIDPLQIRDAILRAKQLPGGMCGSWGACGAAIGAGIGLSVIRRMTAMTKEGWGENILDTAEILQRVGTYGGPRCCKRVTYTALLTAIEILERDGYVQFPEQAHQVPVCKDFWRNKECIKNECPYYPSVSKEQVAKKIDINPENI